MDFRLDRRLDHLFIGGVQPPIPDIVKDGARKEKHVLLDDADLAAQRLQGDVPDVGAVDGDPAGRDVVKPGDEMAQCAFPAARRADESHGGAGRNMGG